MNTVTVDEAKHNLEQLIHRAISDVDPMIVVANNGEKAVVISLEEYSSWQEMTYLLFSPANAARLRKSIAEARTGKLYPRTLIEP